MPALVPLKGSLETDGWGLYQLPNLSQEKLALQETTAQRCEALRGVAGTMLDAFEKAGEPPFFVNVRNLADEKFLKGGDPSSAIMLQAQRNRSVGFSAVGSDLLVKDTEITQPPNGNHELLPYMAIVRNYLWRAAVPALKFFDLRAPNTYSTFVDYDNSRRRDALQCEMAQFLHTWYEPGGRLFGDKDHEKGHKDYPYNGIAVSYQLNPDTVSRWALGEGKDQTTFEQTGHSVVVMSGAVNPFHLVEVPPDSPSREAILLRIGPKQAADFMSNNSQAA